MIKQSKAITMAVAAVMMAFAPVAANAGPNHKNLGAAHGGAKSSVNRGGGGGNHKNANVGKNAGNNNRSANNNRPNNNKKKGGNNVVAGNTVVVGQPNRGGNYNNNNNRYNNGYNNNNGHWENDDNDFLEFVGKTAAITAGVSVVAAVIGSTTNQKPDDCEQTVSNGQVYMNCNGTWYQPVMNNGQQQYTVINPPR